MKRKRPEEQLFRPAVLTASRFDAALFDLDGVVTDTARVHAAAWTQTFDPFLKQWSQDHDLLFEPFSPQDYLSYVDGRPRTEAIRTFLARRGVPLPEGSLSDGPERDTVHGLSARKNRVFLAHIRNDGVDVYPSTVTLIHRLRGLGIKIALVTASRVAEHAGASQRDIPSGRRNFIGSVSSLDRAHTSTRCAAAMEA